MVRTRRIVADWDFKNPRLIQKFLKRIFKMGFVELIIKPSRRKGYHVFVWTRASGKRTKLRLHIGDDRAHIEIDAKRKAAKQTLFNKKRGAK